MAKDETTLQLSLLLLTIVGFNPRRQNILSKFLRAGTIFACFFGISAYSFELIWNYNGVETILNVYMFPHYITYLLTILSMDIGKLKAAIDHLESLSATDKYGPELNKKLSKNHKFVGFLLKQFSATTYGLGVMFMYYSAFVKRPREPPISCCHICDYSNDFCFALLFFWQFCAAFIHFFPLVLGFDSMFLTMIVYVYNALELLEHEIKLLQFADDYDEYRGKLRFIIKEHANILALVDKMNRFFGLTLVFLYCTALASMTFSLYMITSVNPRNPALITSFGTIYMLVAVRMGAFCLGGSVLMSKIASVGEHIFQLPWWKSPKYRKDLSFIILRVQKGDAISVGGIMPLGLPSFIELLRTSTSVYTMLKTLE